MKCIDCRRSIAAGVEAQRMILEYVQPDGSIKIFGLQMPDGPVAVAFGQLHQAHHNRCFWAERKRQARGSAGRLLDVAPSAYEMAELALTGDEMRALNLTEDEARARTAYLSHRVELLRQVAREVGKPIGDPYVLEAFWATESGGSYKHTHGLPLETYQLKAHLHYAHGQHELGSAGFRDLHDQLHARAAGDEVRGAREEDSGYVEPQPSDWRDQSEVDIP